MKNYEFKFRDSDKPEMLIGANPSDALNNSGFGGLGVWRAFEWYKEIIPATIGYINVLLGHTRRGQAVWDTLKFYAVALFTQNNMYAVLTDISMERQWIKVGDTEQLKFKPGFSLEKDLIQLDEPVTVVTE